MSAPATGALLIGYGNPGRLDDGLGPALAAEIEALALPGVTVEANYQLSVEDADAVARHRVVIFADAAVSGPEPFAVGQVAPAGTLSFSTHSVAPEAVLALAKELFNAEAAGYILAIRGYDFDAFGERLSDKARANLAEAGEFLRRLLRGRTTDQMRHELNERSAEKAPPASGEDPCKTASM